MFLFPEIVLGGKAESEVDFDPLPAIVIKFITCYHKDI